MPDEALIFNAARRIDDPAARAAYLALSCGTDAGLRQRVEALLFEDGEAANFLEQPAVATAADPGFDGLDPPTFLTPPGTMIGRYKLLEPIGEGGYGTVFMAAQTSPVHRRVALKIIKAGMDTRQVIARFEAERQALALMDHPNIAKVFDAGVTESGRPYFVMELVKGTPITKYCDEHRLNPRQRLELFIQICHAVQHAHQKGIIHRDLKPTNVLVAQYDGKPVPKVIDFGVAKAAGQQLTEHTIFTGFGDVIGTPQYMSPEQAELNQLDVDTRSDIYSLGVLLYELLTGTTPLESKRMREVALLEALRVIREEEPPRPSTRLTSTVELPTIAAQRGLEPRRLSGLVKGELDWIVMKALEKDRARRYETANGLARDVERYLHDEPVQACPPSAAYRLRKVARRHRLTLGVAAAFVLLLLAATLVSSAWAVRARRAETLAQARLQVATDAQHRAVAETAKAAAISDLLQQALRSANPDDVKGTEYTVRQLLDDLARRTRNQLNNQPLAKAAIHATIGNAYRNLGELKLAEPHLVTALDIRRSVLGPNHPDVAQSLLDHSFNTFESGNIAAAAAEARPALAALQQAGINDNRILRAYALLAFYAGIQGNSAEAHTLAEQAFAVAKQAGITEHPELAKILHDLVGAKLRSGDLSDVEELAARAVTMHRRVEGDEHPETAWALQSQGAALHAKGKLVEAEACLREALTIFRKHYHESHKSIKLTIEPLQRVLTARGDTAGLAALENDRVVRANETLERHAGNLKLEMQLADILRVAGKTEAALAKYDHVMGRRRPDTSPDLLASLAEGYMLVGNALRNQPTKQPEAARALRNAILLREPVDPASPDLRLRVANNYNDLAFCLVSTSRAEAEQASRRALDLKAALVAEYPKNLEYRYHLACTHHGLGMILEPSGRREAALAHLRTAAELFEGVADSIARTSDLSTVHPEWLAQEVGKSFWLILDRFVHFRDYSRAEAMARRALQIFQQLEHARPSEPYFRQERAFSYRKLAEVYDACGDVRGAQRQFDVARGVYVKLIAEFPQSHWFRQELAYTVWSVGNVLSRHGYPEEAARELRLAVDLHKKAAADFPKEWVLRDRQVDVTVQLAVLLVQNGAYEEAASLVIDPAFKPLAWGATTAGAAVMASAIDAAKGDQTLGDERRDALVAAWTPHVQRLVDLAARQCAPTSLNDLNGLAWQLATANVPLSRDPHAIRTAVELAAKAVELKPQDGTVLNTRAVARYRAGEYEQAVADLEKCLELRKGGDAFDFFFLAMAHWQLGHHGQARDWYNKAVAWMDQKQPKNEDLRRFRAEAAELLGVVGDPPPSH